jgi:hypothetical protein
LRVGPAGLPRSQLGSEHEEARSQVARWVGPQSGWLDVRSIDDAGEIVKHTAARTDADGLHRAVGSPGHP